MTKRSSSFHSAERAAFTLLEILLVLALMAVLLVGLSSMIQLFSRHYNANERRVSRAQLARSISQMLSDDLGAAVQDPIQDVPNDPSRQFVRHFGLRGDSRSLQIDVVQPSSFAILADAEENRRVMAGGDKTASVRQVPELKTIFYEFVPINALRDQDAPPPTASSTSSEDGSALAGSLQGAAGTIEAIVGESSQTLYWDGFRPLVQKYGLSRRELDYETPEDEDADAAQTSSQAENEPFNPDESRLSGSLTSPPSSADSSLTYSELEATNEKAKETVFLPPMTAAQIAMDADDGATWAPEVLDCRFSYYDGATWLDSWDSLEKNGLPSAIKVELKLAPLDDVDRYRNSALMMSLPLAPDLETIEKTKAAAASGAEDELNRLGGSLTATAGDAEAKSVDVFNSYRTPASYYAAFRGAPLERRSSSPFDQTQESDAQTSGESEEDSTTSDDAGAVNSTLTGGLNSVAQGGEGLAGFDESATTNDPDALRGQDEFAAQAQELEDSGAVYNSAGVCVDFANDGSYATLESMASEIGVQEPEVIEFVAYLPTTPFSRAKTIQRREPTVVRAGNVAARRNAETANARRAAGQNPYATGRARAPRERTVATREARERTARERTAATRNVAERAIPRERNVGDRELATRGANERAARERAATQRTAQTRQARERFGEDWLAGRADEQAATIAPTPSAATLEPSVPATPSGVGAFDAAQAGVGGGLAGGVNATALPSVDPFAIVDQQTGDVPFADSSSPFASADAALDIVTPGLIASPTGAPTTETPDPTSRQSSQGTTQRSTWIRGKK